ncbi:hypothetical protein T492DRAFT_834034 [Pavlovales sp. CCMP2436]|nr:hypothetical protein T492DRAFT_834034 [Pavlovales sp. CCMP2436]
MSAPLAEGAHPAIAAAAATAAPGATSFFGVRMHSQAPVAGRTPRAAVEAQKAEVLKHRKGDAHGALALFEQALFNYRRYLKPGDPLIVKTLNNIAATYDRIGNGAAGGVSDFSAHDRIHGYWFWCPSGQALSEGRPFFVKAGLGRYKNNY